MVGYRFPSALYKLVYRRSTIDERKGEELYLQSNQVKRTP